MFKNLWDRILNAFRFVIKYQNYPSEQIFKQIKEMRGTDVNNPLRIDFCW